MQKEYCPPLDSSLFHSLLLDYLDERVSLNDLRDTLDNLKEITLATDDAAFDPSGTSGLQDNTISRESSERARSWHANASSDSTEDTDLTNLPQATKWMTFGGSTAEDKRTEAMNLDKEEYDRRNEELPSEEKAGKIKEIIPGAKDFDIIYTLKKYDNNFVDALYDLLNQNFLVGGTGEGEKLSKKGIEAFTEPAMTKRQRTAMKEREKRGKRQQLRRTSSSPALDSTSDSPLSSNQWLRVDDCINFIVNRTFMNDEFIRSVYHSSGATLPSTIAALCTSEQREASSNPYLLDAPLAEVEAHGKKLFMEFPHRLQYPQALALIKLTYPSTTSARELALELMSSPNAPSTSTITPHYILRPPSPPSTSPSSPSSPSPYVALPDSKVATLASIRSHALTQSQSAFRKSKSNHLMGAAASHYSTISRDADAALRQDTAAHADARVSSQSNPGEIDLHGLNVKDAVRISRNRVEAWWESEGREWARAGKVMNDGGLRIITGIGRHSAGGKAVLGPAVGRMLNDEGWKVQVGDGVVKVVGRARR